MLRRSLKYLTFFLLSSIAIYAALIILSPITFTETVDHDHTLPALTLNGHKFHSEAFGNPENPLLIALHGGPGGDYRYMLSLKELSNKYFVVMYDQRMTGLSSRSSDQEITIQSFYDDLDSFIEHYRNNKSVYIVGHSWGAMLASGYAGIHPEKISKIILIEPGILRADISEQFLKNSGPNLAFIDYVMIAKIWLSKWRVDITQDPHARDDYFLSMMYLYIGNKGKKAPHNFIGWRMGSFAVDQTLGKCEREPEYLATLDFLNGVENFNGQVLFLTSENNKVYGADYQLQHLKYYKNAQQQIIPNAGHTIFIDQPEITNKMIDAFIEHKP